MRKGGSAMNVDQLTQQLQHDPLFMKNVVRWETMPPREAHYADFPEALDERLKPVLARRGVHRLYTHQAHAVREVLAGQDIVVVTPTASGKTMCYNLPVLSAILKKGDGLTLEAAISVGSSSISISMKGVKGVILYSGVTTVLYPSCIAEN